MRSYLGNINLFHFIKNEHLRWYTSLDITGQQSILNSFKDDIPIKGNRRKSAFAYLYLNTNLYYHIKPWLFASLAGRVIHNNYSARLDEADHPDDDYSYRDTQWQLNGSQSLLN